MKVKYTPGPWKLTNDSYVSVITDIEGNEIVCVRDEDNAQIISLCPEFIDVLRESRKFVFSVAPYGGLLERIDNVLRKTGEQ